MPRPPAKRRRHNHSTSHLAPSQQQHRSQIPNQARAREAHAKILASKPIGRRPADSDDSDDLVTTRRNGLPRNRRQQEIYASGAVAEGDQPGVWPTKAQRTRSMRQDTAEILIQRSRSTSRANSVPSDDENSAAHPQPRQSGRSSNTEQRKTLGLAAKPWPNGVSQTPQADMSVLGRIKPRKRQASILQLIENENQHLDSSSLSGDDDTGFLPDEISTPLNPAYGTQAPGAGAAFSSKRKRDPDNLQSLNRIRPRELAVPVEKPQIEPLQPSRSQQTSLSAGNAAQETDDIMALPESSDEEDSREKPVVAAVVPRRSVKSPEAAIPSTQQLRDLMPSKKHNAQRHRQANDEFDIPVDSDEHDTEDEPDVSLFVPTRRRKAPKQPAAKPTAKMRSKGKVNVKTRTKRNEQSKSTRITSFTPLPMGMRTPRLLPSVSKDHELQAKPPSKQVSTTVMQVKTTNPPLPPRAGGKKQYGGSRESRKTAQAGGKENQPVGSLFDEPSSGNSTVLDLPQQPRQYAATADVRAWNKKWADIDDFSLDFEDISASTRSSSPTAR